MTAEIIARNLGGRKAGASWIACCPAHDDKHPSLSITERDGKILVHCHAGCEQRAVVDALRALGLWPERQRQEWTSEQRQDFVQRRRAAEALAADAWYWRSARIAEIECMQRAALEKEAWSIWEAKSRELYLLRMATESEYLQRFIAARHRDPEHVVLLIQEARSDEAHAAAVTALVVAAISRMSEVQHG